MQPSNNLVEALSDIKRMSTTGQVRRVGAEMLLALARKEISATDVDAAAKMIAAEAMHLKAEIDVHFKAALLRDRGGDLGKLPALGRMSIDIPGNQGQFAGDL